MADQDPAGGGPSFEVEVVDETAFAVDQEAAMRLALLVLAEERVAEGAVALAFVEEDAMADLNERYRAKSGATDVLSFPGGEGDDPDWPEPEPEAEEAPYLGDVVVCPAVAERNAAADGVGVDDELRRLVVHGVLHLLGYDHEVDGGEMRSREDALLAGAAAGLPPLLRG